ncbi:MAG TPA: SIR2 family protein [Microlunatus sp.]|nr:SIR2 family protein [Microlunatus sp.]
MPVFGVGSGGFKGQRGAVLDRLLNVLESAVAAPGSADVALILHARADYAAVQSRRREHFKPSNSVGALSERVRQSGLVLFIGAGASAGAGFPTWNALLAELADQTHLSEEVRRAVLRLPAPDAADVIGSELGNLQALIAERFAQDGCALTHALLASLRVREAVTTNYDTLYENAAVIPHGKALKVLPRERRSADEPWLLKLHGDIKLDNSIVLTRDQYLRFDADSVPLASVVQSSMVTNHMLFIGYSLSDENFIRLARQVRHLFRAAGTDGPVGTVLTLFEDPARHRMWQGDLDFIPMVPTAPVRSDDTCGEVSPSAIAAAARRLDIFLDQLAAASCDDAPYVLNERYRELLSADDQVLADALQRLREAAGSSGRRADSPAWAKARNLLRELGWAPDKRG